MVSKSWILCSHHILMAPIWNVLSVIGSSGFSHLLSSNITSPNCERHIRCSNHTKISITWNKPVLNKRGHLFITSRQREGVLCPIVDILVNFSRRVCVVNIRTGGVHKYKISVDVLNERPQTLNVVLNSTTCPTGLHYKALPRLHEIGWESCIFFIYCRQENANFPPKIHTTWEGPYSAAL